MNKRLVKVWLAQNGLTQKELANRLGINPTTLWRNMTGETSQLFVLALAQVIGCTAEDLLTDDKKPARRGVSRRTAA